MKKIGLFLDADPSHGGTFQYNQNILAGVAALPRDQFEVVVGYTSPDWVEHIVRHDLPTTRIPRAPLSQAGFMLWNWLHLSVGLWREASRFFHPKAKAFLREGCDLWIFPSQEDLSLPDAFAGFGKHRRPLSSPGATLPRVGFAARVPLS